jgi:Ca2+-binding RTX toxin-like protein
LGPQCRRGPRYGGRGSLLCRGEPRLGVRWRGGADELEGAGGIDTLIGGSGNDILNGGALGDTMRGGDGNDTYVVGSASDKVFEASGAGSDKITSSINYDLSAPVERVVQSIEHLQLVGTVLTATGNDLANLTGNNLANTLSGGAGNDILVGDADYYRSRSDKLIGGTGDDSYFIKHAGDKVIEADGAGVDTITAQVSFSLATLVDGSAQFAENLVLANDGDGSDARNGTGNDLANRLTGNWSSNKLSGGGGVDTLVGNGGSDTLDGGTLGDTLIGGDGHDTYLVDIVGDKVIERGSWDSDTVKSTIDFDLQRGSTARSKSWRT